MKYLPRPFYLCLLVVLLAALGVAYLVFYPQKNLLFEIGSLQSPKANAKLEFTTGDPGLLIERQVSGFDLKFFKYGMTASVSPTGWKNYKGFFAYVDEVGRFWVYNGRDQTWIYERLAGGGGKSWDIESWQGAIPHQFVSRIPEDSKVFK